MTKFDHRRDLRGLAFDKVDNESGPDAGASALMKEDGSPIVDSAKAHRILTGCIGKLSADDMMTVADLMAGKDMIDAGELEALKTALAGSRDGGEGDNPATAMDSAIMSRRRAQVAAGLRPASDLRLPINRGMSTAEQKSFEERYGTDRIKHV